MTHILYITLIPKQVWGPESLSTVMFLQQKVRKLILSMINSKHPQISSSHSAIKWVPQPLTVPQNLFLKMLEIWLL